MSAPRGMPDGGAERCFTPDVAGRELWVSRDFTAEEFSERRMRIAATIGAGAHLLAASAPPVPSDARVQGPALLGTGTTIAGGARVGPDVVLGPGCRIEADVTITDSVLGAGTVVEVGATVQGLVSGTGARVGTGATLTGPATIGDGAVVPPGSDLAPGARLPPS